MQQPVKHVDWQGVTFGQQPAEQGE
jgi:hypothetical protein